jgi:hypothetical protein
MQRKRSEPSEAPAKAPIGLHATVQKIANTTAGDEFPGGYKVINKELAGNIFKLRGTLEKVY